MDPLQWLHLTTFHTRWEVLCHQRISDNGTPYSQVSYSALNRVLWPETSGEYLKIGRPALVEGRLEQDRWESQDGSKRSKHKIVANQVVFLGGRGDSTTTSAPTERPVDDDIPF